MSSASLAVAARPHPDAARVAALSAAIALNLAALLILTRPLAPQALALAHKLATVPQIVLIEPPPPVPQPPPIELKPLPHPPPMPVHVLYPHRRHLSLRVQGFIAWLQEQLAPCLDAPGTA